MINAELTTNALEVIEDFKKFNIKEMRKATKTALRKGAQVLAKKTRQLLKSRLPNATKRNKKYRDRLSDGVRYKVDKNGDIAKVHIMGSRKKGSGTFRLRFFEKGTKVRKNRGQIKPLHFFKSAGQQSQNEVNNAVTQHLIETIKKIKEKRSQ